MSDGDLFFIEDTTGGRLGRTIVHHNPRNRAFPVRGMLFAADAPLRTKIHRRVGVFDQGHESSCTMQAAVGVLRTSPFAGKLARSNRAAYDTPLERYEAYKRAQRLDPWPGESYDGSSTDAPYKLFRDERRIREWRWCFGLDDVLRALSHYGPVSIGTNWHAGMEQTDGAGYVHPTGAILGGHAYELVGISVDSKSVLAVNSWGTAWGVNGRMRLTWDELDQLLKASGDACTVVL